MRHPEVDQEHRQRPLRVEAVGVEPPPAEDATPAAVEVSPAEYPSAALELEPEAQQELRQESPDVRTALASEESVEPIAAATECLERLCGPQKREALNRPEDPQAQVLEGSVEEVEDEDRVPAGEQEPRPTVKDNEIVIGIVIVIVFVKNVVI